jgi:hypothetical protein
MLGYEAVRDRQTGPRLRGRPVKFTPERIDQIKNLVERGKSREEIAEMIDVTPGSLSVTCSKLGISLRKKLVNNGVRLLGPPRRPSLSIVHTHERSDEKPAEDRLECPAPDAPRFSLRMEYKGAACGTEFAFIPEMVERLALEAELRGLRIGELIRDIVLSTVKNDFFREVLRA